MNANSLREELVEAIIEGVQFEIKNNDEDNVECLIETGTSAMFDAIGNMIIYTSTCKEIIDALDFDLFSDDNCYGIVPHSYENAADIALTELGNNEINMEEIVNNELNK